MKDLLLKTIYISLFVQIVTGIISSSGLFLEVKKENKVLHDALLFEVVVQVVEFIFYSLMAYNLLKIDVNHMTKYRYLDWVITTPLMLLSTILVMEYNESRKTNKYITLGEVFRQNKNLFIQIILLNFGMLLFGYLGETRILDKRISLLIGIVFFGINFYTIWQNFGSKNQKSKNLYYFLVIVWSLFGVAAMLPEKSKNIMYNGLDLVAKNGYGMYLFYEIAQLKK